MLNYDLIFLTTSLLNISGSENLEIIYRTPPIEETIILISALISVILIIIAQFFYKLPLSNIFYNLLNISDVQSRLKHNFSDQNVNTRFAGILLLVMCYISVVGLAYSYFTQIYPTYNNSFSGPYTLYSVLFLTIGLYFAIKILANLFLATVLRANNVLSQYYRSSINYLQITGVLVLPIYLFIPFVNEKVQISLLGLGLLLVLISFLLRIIKGFLISFRIKFPIQYAILYFCIFEIIPLLILLEYFRNLL